MSKILMNLSEKNNKVDTILNIYKLEITDKRKLLNGYIKDEKKIKEFESGIVQACENRSLSQLHFICEQMFCQYIDRKTEDEDPEFIEIKILMDCLNKNLILLAPKFIEEYKKYSYKWGFSPYIK